MIKIADLEGNEIVLDLGTGAGLLAIGFSKRLKNGKVYGLDKYHLKYQGIGKNLVNYLKINFIGNTLNNAIRNAKIENVGNKCEFISTDLTKRLNFSDEYFNIILSSQFLYCLSPKKRQLVFNEINRVLRKGGKIIFFESRAFLRWDIDIAKRYFEKMGYKINIEKIKEFRRSSILSGTKL
jgi:ubiquinone/menaquinone biosynthesis C-methylase UbiE